MDSTDDKEMGEIRVNAATETYECPSSEADGLGQMVGKLPPGNRAPATSIEGVNVGRLKVLTE